MNYFDSLNKSTQRAIAYAVIFTAIMAGLRSLVNQYNTSMTWIVFFHEHPPVTVWARSLMDARREALRQSGLKDRDIRGCNMRADS